MRPRLLAVWWLSISMVMPAWSDERRDPTVGAEGLIEQLILPGSELVGRPISDKMPVVVRVINAYRHGDQFRYDIQFFGLEPGEYDLAEFLVRKDGTSVDDLPDIPISVRSLLPPGQIEPNPLDHGWFPQLGGYRTIALLAALLWLAIFLTLCFWRRVNPAAKSDDSPPMTFAELLRPRLEAAQQSRMTPAQYAELERMLFAFWRQRLQLESESPEQALAAIHQHSDSGPLMRQLEQWMHNPAGIDRQDLNCLLEPYRNFPAESIEVAT